MTEPTSYAKLRHEICKWPQLNTEKPNKTENKMEQQKNWLDEELLEMNSAELGELVEKGEIELGRSMSIQVMQTGTTDDAASMRIRVTKEMGL